MSKILNGKDVALAIDENTISSVEDLKNNGVDPLLSIIRIGNNPDDFAYQNSILKKCEKLGVRTNVVEIPSDASQEEVEETVKREEKNLRREGRILERSKKREDRKAVKQIKEDYKYELKDLRADHKDKARDNRKLQSFAGSTEGTELEEKYHQYQEIQTEKDIHKLEKKIHTKEKQINKIEQKIQKVTDETKKLLPENSLEGEVSNTEDEKQEENIQFPQEDEIFEQTNNQNSVKEETEANSEEE